MNAVGWGSYTSTEILCAAPPSKMDAPTRQDCFRLRCGSKSSPASQGFVPTMPQSEVLAEFWQEIGEKCGEMLAKFFADFRPSISRENGRKNFHKKSSTFSTVCQIKFFHCCSSGGWGGGGAQG